MFVVYVGVNLPTKIDFIKSNSVEIRLFNWNAQA